MQNKHNRIQNCGYVGIPNWNCCSIDFLINVCKIWGRGAPSTCCFSSSHVLRLPWMNIYEMLQSQHSSQYKLTACSQLKRTVHYFCWGHIIIFCCCLSEQKLYTDFFKSFSFLSFIGSVHKLRLNKFHRHSSTKTNKKRQFSQIASGALWSNHTLQKLQINQNLYLNKATFHHLNMLCYVWAVWKKIILSKILLIFLWLFF